MTEKGLESVITTDLVEHVIKDIRPSKMFNTFLSFAGKISNTRALIYAFMCGGNNNEVNELELLAGCNRFGIENPLFTVTKRLSLFGND